MIKEKGQLSLEYMIVLAAFLALLGMLAPFLVQTQALAQLSLDKKTAQVFLAEIKGKTDQLKLMGDGSNFTIRVRPINSWIIIVDDDEIEVVFPQLKNLEEKSEPLKVTLGTELEDNILDVNGLTVFSLKKEGGEISLTKSEP